jgi:hypothetical protein
MDDALRSYLEQRLRSLVDHMRNQPGQASRDSRLLRPPQV